MSKSDEQLLACGTKFVPTPKPNRSRLLSDFDTLKERIRRHFNRSDSNGLTPSSERKFLLSYSNRGPPIHAPAEIEEYLAKTRQSLIKALELPQLRRKENITASQHALIKKLRDSSEYIIKPSDKNLGLTLLNRSWYDTEVMRQLSDKKTYQPVDRNTIPIKPTYEKIRSLINSAFKNKLITQQQRNFVLYKITPEKTQVPQIYILPKIHKSPVKGRPIVPGFNWITTPSSILLDHLLQPLVKTIPTVITDSKSLVNKLESTRIVDPNCRLLTADVTSLYTEIETKAGIAFVRTLMREHPEMYSPDMQEFIFQLLTIVMDNNYLQFNGQFYKQIKGTAMGTPVAPTYANIFMYILERIVIKKYRENILLYYRYLDDVFMVIKSGIDTLAIKSSFNTMKQGILMEFSESSEQAIFLDLCIFKGSRFESLHLLDLKVYQKPLNAYLYIPFFSFHPPRVMNGIVLTELKRYVRNSSSIQDYIAIKRQFWSRLKMRGFPDSFLTRTFSKVWYTQRTQLLLPKEPKNSDLTDTVFFTTDYTPLVTNLPKLNTLLNEHLPENHKLSVKIGFRKTANLFNILCRNTVWKGNLSAPLTQTTNNR